MSVTAFEQSVNILGKIMQRFFSGMILCLFIYLFFRVAFGYINPKIIIAPILNI